MDFKFRTNEDEAICLKLAESEGLKIEEWVKHRYKMLGQLDNFMPDFRKSQDMKRNWRLDKNRYLSSMVRWHKSVAGKRFHRQLSRYLALRAPLYKESLAADSLDMSSEESSSIAAKIALNSLQTHLLIESLYIEPNVEEHANMREFLRYAEAYVLDIYKKIDENINLTSEDILFLEEISNG